MTERETAGGPPVAKVIERAKSELEQMIDVSPFGMALTDRAGKIIRVNQGLLRLLGMPRFDAVLGRRLHDLIPQALPEELPAGDASATTAGPAARHVIETEVSLPERGLAVLSFTFMSMPGPAADLVVVLVDDITERRQESARLERKLRTQASKAVVAGMLHELGQPLTVVAVRAHLLGMAAQSKTLSPDELQAGLQEITANADLCAGILKQAGRLEQFVTEPYAPNLPGVDMVDIAGSTRAANSRPRVLLDARTAESLRRFLAESPGADFDYISAAEAGELCALLAAAQPPFDILLVDLDLAPSAATLLRDAQRSDPGLPVVLLTGGPVGRLADELKTLAAGSILQKPVTPGHLVLALQRAARKRAHLRGQQEGNP